MSYTLPAFLVDRIDSFTGREWLLGPIMHWRGDGTRRFFVLTGGPGTGKSMVAAWLSGAGPMPTDPNSRSKLTRIRKCVGAAHFCGDGGGNKDPKTAAHKMAAQLEANVPGFREALLASLDSRFQVDVNIRVGTAAPGSSVIGLVIENLGNLSGEIAFNRLLRDPLVRVYGQGYNEPLVLIVDSLDEAEAFSGDVRFPYLISTLTDLPAQVSILVTTRPDERVLQYFPGASARKFDLVEDAPKEFDDILLYANRSLAQLSSTARGDLAGQVSYKAQGVFLYASLILPELIAVMEKGGDPSGVPLPQSLTELYGTFLSRELTRDKDKWLSVYAPLLGAIAIAQGSGLDREQLGGLVDRGLGDALLTCKQYLVGETARGPFRIFHQSFIEFLFDEQAMGSFCIDPHEMHRRIVESYEKRFKGRWNAIDAYGIDYLLWHLLEADAERKLDGIHGDTYATRHLFFHLVNGELADEIGKLVARVCQP